jgi:ERCC4-type nuclease
MTERNLLVIVSKSEPDNSVPQLCTFGINAVWGEGGTDYVWFPAGLRFGLERKTASNLLQSLKDRQLVEQAHKGVADFDHYFLLIEGELRRHPSGKLQYHSPRHPAADKQGFVISGFEYSAVEGMLFDLGLLGVQIVYCPLYDYARTIAKIVAHTYAQDHSFLRQRQRPELPPAVALGGRQYEQIVWSLCALPGIGPETAIALLQHYGTYAEVIAALASGSSSLNEVRVGGKRLAASRIRRAIEAITAPYGGGAS